MKNSRLKSCGCNWNIDSWKLKNWITVTQRSVGQQRTKIWRAKKARWIYMKPAHHHRHQEGHMSKKIKWTTNTHTHCVCSGENWIIFYVGLNRNKTKKTKRRKNIPLFRNVAWNRGKAGTKWWKTKSEEQERDKRREGGEREKRRIFDLNTILRVNGFNWFLFKNVLPHQHHRFHHLFDSFTLYSSPHMHTHGGSLQCSTFYCFMCMY